MMVAATTALIAAAGCGESLDGTQGPAQTVDVEAGRVAYDATCASCHGVEGRGTGKGPSFIDRIYEPSHHADAAFLLAVVRGVPAHHWNFGDMPPQPAVSQADVRNIVQYIRDLQRDAGIS